MLYPLNVPHAVCSVRVIGETTTFSIFTPDFIRASTFKQFKLMLSDKSNLLAYVPILEIVINPPLEFH